MMFAETEGNEDGGKDDETMLLFLVGAIVAVVMVVALIGGLCYLRINHFQNYAKLPG